MTIVASIIDVGVKRTMSKSGRKLQTSQTDFKLTKAASPLAPFLAVVLLIMRNLF